MKRNFVGLFCVVGIAGVIGFIVAKYSPPLLSSVLPSSWVYETSTPWHTDETVYSPLKWEMLIPENERNTIARYQVPETNTLQDLTQQILNSIESAGDKAYQSAMISTNTVASLSGSTVSISGFVVPIDFYPNKNLKYIFLVPYFGACTHFPPPPPNQILFIRLEDGFSHFDINQAFTFEGKLKTELFEDLIGTSAYTLEAYRAKKFSGEPDTFREHSSL